MLTPINLDSSGLCCSSRADVLNRHGKVYSNTTTLMNQDAHFLHSASPQTHLRSTSPLSFKSALVLFYTICSFGYGLSCMAHSLLEKVTEKITSHVLQWQTIPNSLLEPRTLQSNIIIFAIMKSRSQIPMDSFNLTIALQMIRYQIYSQNLFVSVEWRGGNSRLGV